MEKVYVKFDLDDKEIEIEKGSLLSEACSKAGYTQDLICGGKGICKKCTVDILKDGQAQTVLSCKYLFRE